MYKKITITLLALICFSCLAVQTFAADSENVSTSAPLRLCFWPDVWDWPSGIDVYGLNLGLPASYNANRKNMVAGLDLALLFSQTNVKGIQLSMLNMSDGTDGVQLGIVNMGNNNVAGAQVSVYNEYKNSIGLQLGLINKAEHSKGIQLGLINMMDNGFFPIFPIINFGFK